jgi:glucose/mannose transport system permease protein
VALTKGGPGNYSDVPAKYVFDHMFARANVGQGLAASTIMLLTVLIILVPWMYYEYGSRSRRTR